MKQALVLKFIPQGRIKINETEERNTENKQTKVEKIAYFNY